MQKEDRFYTSEELASKLKVNVMTIYRYIKSGKIKAYKFGKEFRVEHSEFEAFLKKHINVSEK